MVQLANQYLTIAVPSCFEFPWHRKMVSLVNPFTCCVDQHIRCLETKKVWSLAFHSGLEKKSLAMS